MGQASCLRNRLNDAGFVIGEHERNECPWSLEAARACASAARSIRPSPVAGTRSTADGCKPPSRQHRRVLDRGHQQPLERLPMGSARRRERQHVGLRAARGEHHVARLSSNQRGDPRRGHPQSAAGRRGPRHAPRTDCRRSRTRPWRRRAPAAAAERLHSSRGRFARSWSLIALRPCCSPKPMASPIPFETLAFCPRTRAKKAAAATTRACRRRCCWPNSRMVLNSYV